MHRYASSKWRLGLLALLMAAAGTSLAQTLPSAAAPPAPPAAGLFQLIMGHLDFIFFTIFILSVWGLTLIIQGFIKNRESVMMPVNTTQLIREMINQRRLDELVQFTENDPSFVSRALNPALKRFPNFTSMKEAMETAIGEETANQFRSIEYLNIIGNLGPLLGLLGTVLGMIQAFSEMNAKGGQANPADLAFGISTALTHTFLGLFLAVPCLAAFGILRTRVDRLTVRGALTAEELLFAIKPPDVRPATAPMPRGVPQPSDAPIIPPPPPPVTRKPMQSFEG